MEHNFETVDKSDPNNYILANDMITTETKMYPSSDLQDTIVLECTITNDAHDYGIELTRNSYYIVHLSDGKVLQYSIFDQSKHINSVVIGSTNTIGYYNSHALDKLEIFGIESTDKIEYIKIANVILWRTHIGNKIFTNSEIEIYSKISNMPDGQT